MARFNYDVERQELSIKTDPGAAIWTKLPDGSFKCRFGAHGGSTTRPGDAKTVAVHLFDRAPYQELSSAMRDLGWNDVLAEIDLKNDAPAPAPKTKP